MLAKVFRARVDESDVKRQNMEVASSVRNKALTNSGDNILIPSLFFPFSLPICMSLTELSNAENVSFNRDKPRTSNTEMRLVECRAVADDGGGCLAGDDGAFSSKDDPAELLFISNSLSSRVLVKADRVSRLLQPIWDSDVPTPLLTVVILLLLLPETRTVDDADTPSLRLQPPTP